MRVRTIRYFVGTPDGGVKIVRTASLRSKRLRKAPMGRDITENTEPFRLSLPKSVEARFLEDLEDLCLIKQYPVEWAPLAEPS